MYVATNSDMHTCVAKMDENCVLKFKFWGMQEISLVNFKSKHRTDM